jgi:hypothetical protein
LPARDLRVPEERSDGPCALAVESGGGFVEEEEKLGLAGEFDSEGADDGVGVIFETTRLQTRFNTKIKTITIKSVFTFAADR